MAELKRDGDELVVELSLAEKAEAVHGDIRVPASSVREVEVVEDAIHALEAWKKSIGTFRQADGKVFAAVHHDTPRGVKVVLEGANFDALVIGCADPEEVVTNLGTF